MNDHQLVVSNSGMKAGEYYTHLVKEFPELKDEIEELDPDEVFSNMEEFARYTNRQIKSGNIEELSRCFNFQESKIDLVDDLLLNALNVSYCEALLLGEYSSRMETVVNLMGPKLKQLYRDYEDYYNNLGKKK